MSHYTLHFDCVVCILNNVDYRRTIISHSSSANYFSKISKIDFLNIMLYKLYTHLVRSIDIYFF